LYNALILKNNKLFENNYQIIIKLLLKKNNTSEFFPINSSFYHVFRLHQWPRKEFVILLYESALLNLE